MPNSRLLTLMILIGLLLSPTLMTWVLNPEGAWYRPYLIWTLVIVTSLIVQLRPDRHDI